MPISILVLALVLVFGGFGGVLLGLSLTPTDMGRMWLETGVLLLTGGGIVLAIGFATQALLNGLAARAEQMVSPQAGDGGQTASASAVPPPVEQPLVLAPQETPTLEAPERPVEPRLSPVMAAAGGAVAAGAAAFGAWRSPKSEQPEPDPEIHHIKDPFEEILAQETPVISAEAEAQSAAATLETGLRLAPLHDEPEPPREDEVSGQYADAIEAMPVPAESEPEEAAFDELAAAEPLSETRGHEAEGDGGPAPQDAAAPTPAGLLHDEDLVALTRDEPPLASLEGLEVVGAYDSAGVRFTMYSDGSVNAVAPHGERRYRSLEALRAQLDKGEAAV